MTEARLSTFAEFWPYYLGQHRDPVNRFLHYVGTVAAVLAAIVGIATLSPGFVLMAPVFGYLPAWVGHLLIERNRPATWLYPEWSLAADFQMLALATRLRAASEVERVLEGGRRS